MNFENLKPGVSVSFQPAHILTEVQSMIAGKEYLFLSGDIELPTSVHKPVITLQLRFDLSQGEGAFNNPLPFPALFGGLDLADESILLYIPLEHIKSFFVPELVEAIEKHLL